MTPSNTPRPTFTPFFTNTPAGLDDTTVSRSAILGAMVKHPKLIERPIVAVNNKKAALGRPPENILKVLK